MPGRVVLLNGPSSAGKSSLAAALVERLDTPWLVVPVDLLHAVRSRPDLRGVEVDDAAWADVFRATRAGYHRVLAGLAAGGADVIGDHVLTERWRVDDLLDVTVATDLLLVHVTASAAELERRERERGDREPGTALTQLDTVFAHRDCDLLVDTTDLSPAESAGLVAALVADPPSERAFDRLRAARR